MNMYTGINLDNVDYAALTLSLMIILDEELGYSIAEEEPPEYTDHIDRINRDTARMLDIEFELGISEWEAAIAAVQ